MVVSWPRSSSSFLSDFFAKHLQQLGNFWAVVSACSFSPRHVVYCRQWTVFLNIDCCTSVCQHRLQLGHVVVDSKARPPPPFVPLLQLLGI